MTDRELVNKVLSNGDQQSFAEIMRRYSGMVYSKALGIVHREDLAKDIAQQTFIRAYERMAYWHSEKLGPWLVTIAMHTAVNELERERRHAQPVQADDDDDPDREELLQRMEAAIGELSELDQAIIRMHYYEHRKTDDIARITGLSQSNVLVRLHRIRDRLRQKLSTSTIEP